MSPERIFSLTQFTRAQANCPGRVNEDALCSGEDEEFVFAAVLDGASAISGITGVAKAMEQNGFFAAQNACWAIKDYADISASAEELLYRANVYLGLQVKKTGINPEEHDDITLSNAQAVVARIEKMEDALDVALLGDVACLIGRNDGSAELFIEPDFTQEDVDALQFILDVVQQTGMPFRDVLKKNIYSNEVDAILVQGRERANTPLGTGVGVLDGRSSAVRYIRTRQVPLKGITHIALLTDGLFLPKKDIHANPNWQAMMDIIIREGLEGLYDRVTRLKNSDPTFDELPRLKDHDDATGILISIE